MQINLAQSPVGVSIGGAGAPAPAPAAMPSWIELWNESEIQIIVAVSFGLQVILFFFAGIRRYSVSSVLKVLLWLVYLLADVVATYALGHMSSSLSKNSSGEHQLVAFWAPFLLLHLGGQDTITAYALEDNELWQRHMLNMLREFLIRPFLKICFPFCPKTKFSSLFDTQTSFCSLDDISVYFCHSRC